MSNPSITAETEAALKRQRDEREARQAATAAEQAQRIQANARLRAARLEALDDERAAKTAAHEAAELDRLKATLRGRYLAQPGATPESFEHAWPDLHQEHLKREAARDPLEEARRAGPYF